jgi:flagellar biosynthesis/type III secretory pathway protein FliH
MNRYFLVPVLGMALVGISASAHAQSSWGTSRRVEYGERQSYYDSRRAAYDNGFREGAKQGEKDGRKGNVFAYQDERTFQRADKGYHRDFGDIERYRQAFRSGYASGYSESYQRYAPAYGNNGRYGSTYPRGDGRYDTRGNGRYDPRNNGGYGTRPGYPGGGYYSPAYDNGAQDGYQKGAEDARKNRSFDVLRHEWYRDGDRHYESRYGSRDQYKNVYRDGFKEGYARGYQEGRYRY